MPLEETNAKPLDISLHALPCLHASKSRRVHIRAYSQSTSTACPKHQQTGKQEHKDRNYCRRAKYRFLAVAPSATGQGAVPLALTAYAPNTRCQMEGPVVSASRQGNRFIGYCGPNALLQARRHTQIQGQQQFQHPQQQGRKNAPNHTHSCAGVRTAASSTMCC